MVQPHCHCYRKWPPGVWLGPDRCGNELAGDPSAFLVKWLRIHGMLLLFYGCASKKSLENGFANNFENAKYQVIT